MREEDLKRLEKNKSLQETVKSWIRFQITLLRILAGILISIIVAIVSLAVWYYVVSVTSILFALGLFVLGAFYVMIRLYREIKEFELTTRLIENDNK